MKRFLSLTMAAALAVSALSLPAVAGAQDPDWPADRTISAPPDDPEIGAAQAQARRTLPLFWGKYRAASHPVGDYLVRAAFRTSHGGNEFMWIDVMSYDGGVVAGRLNNIPDDVPSVHNGDIVKVSDTRIDDWMYWKGGIIYGAFTTRVLIKRMPPDEAAKVVKLLSPNPLESADTV